MNVLKSGQSFNRHTDDPLWSGIDSTLPCVLLNSEGSNQDIETAMTHELHLSQYGSCQAASSSERALHCTFSLSV